MTTDEAFLWTDHFLLGYPPMDDTHREFVELVEALRTAPDEAIPACIEAFERHAVEHFEAERAWMAETAFPALQCHVDEHDAVLHSVRQVRDMLANGGDTAVARNLARALMDWFPGHADYMDASLAQWMTKKRTGGIPVVLRRGVAASEEIDPALG